MTLFWITLGAAAILASVTLVLYFKEKKKQKTVRAQLEDIKKKNIKNYLFALYKVYKTVPLIRRYFNKLRSKLRVNYPADEVSINAKATNQMSLFLAISLVLLTAIILLGGTDIPYIIVGVLVVYITFTNLVNNADQEMQRKLLDQLDTLISEVRANFEDSKSPSIALLASIEEIPFEIGLHAHIIYDMITSPSIEDEIGKYVDIAPNKFLLLFATILGTIEEHGDKILDDGRSMFLKNLDYLKQELGNERNKLQKRQFAFSGKVYATLAALLVLKPIEIWSISNMPETRAFYEGSLGTISLFIVMAITFVCYEGINILKDDPSSVSEDYKPIKKLCDMEICKKYISAYINHNYTKCKRVADMLKAVGDTSGINVFLMRRVVYAVSIFIATIGICFYSLSLDKYKLLHDFENAYDNSIVLSEEYRQIMEDVSEEQGKNIKRKYSKEQLGEAIGEEISPLYKEQILSELEKREAQYSDKNFKWWMLLIALGDGVIGYFIPNVILLAKRKVLLQIRDEEVAQFKTIILILMHEDGMTIDKILEWLERFAHAFKPSITDCIFYLSQNEEKALRQMREEEMGYGPFRRFCDSLLAVDKVGVEAAFEGLETDREHDKDKRKQDNEELLAKCSTWASRLELIPLMAGSVFLYLLVPMVVYSLKMGSEFFKSI